MNNDTIIIHNSKDFFNEKAMAALIPPPGNKIFVSLAKKDPA